MWSSTVCHQTELRSTNDSRTCDQTDKKSNKNHNSGVEGTVPHVRQRIEAMQPNGFTKRQRNKRECRINNNTETILG